MEPNVNPVDDGQAGIGVPQEPIEQNDPDAQQPGNNGDPAGLADQQPEPAKRGGPDPAMKERRIKAERDTEDLRKQFEEFKTTSVRDRDQLIHTIFGGQYRNYDEWKAVYDAQVLHDQATAKNMSDEDYAAWMDTQRKAEEADRRATETEQRLAKYERREEINKMTAEMESHPQYGAWFKDHRADVLAFADALDHTQGTAQEQLEMATMLMLAKGYAPPQPVDEAAIEQRGVQKYIESLKKQNAPVEPRGGGIPTSPPAPSTGNAVKDAYRASVDRLTRTQR